MEFLTRLSPAVPDTGQQNLPKPKPRALCQARNNTPIIISYTHCSKSGKQNARHKATDINTSAAPAGHRMRSLAN